MIFRNFAILVATASISRLCVDAADTWRPDLDWDGFGAKLSPTASLIDTSFSDYLDQCLPEFRDNDYEDRTAHALIDQPSGMCVSMLYCAYEQCWPRPDAANSTQAQRIKDERPDESPDPFFRFEDLSQESQGWLEDSQNPSLNLPSKVLFPVVASDVVEAVRFAREHGLEISVKNSGHSFSGASTKKDTLHINMNRFTQYSPTSIVDCEPVSDGAVVDLADQPCSLAVARNKPAFVRVGGGENWDKIYRAVEAANIEQGNKYHAVGGAAGTVSPMGWTFQGGLAGTQGGRMYGLGVDQVLQVEMVLPNGEHVKFGPVEWEDASADGFIVPKTTSVAGVCRSNPEELDETLWEWAECPEEAGINFDDLWFAVNGGGGGTWGVVTSIYLQLHDYLTPRIFGLNEWVDLFPFANFPDCEVKEALKPFFEAFRLRYVLAPSTLNVSQADSDACGMADAYVSALMCFGDIAYQTLIDAWNQWVTDYFDPEFYGFSLEDALACPGTVESSWLDFVKYPEGQYAGQAADAPLPTIPTLSTTGSINLLIPQKWIDENFESVAEFWTTSGPGFYLPFGTGTASASDQANSLGKAHRIAGLRTILPAAAFFGDSFGQFGDMYDISDKANFPSIQGSNHIGPTNMGPLKEDWNIPCPDEWTKKERDEKCVSIQETLWGTKTLARLEAIKEALDPDYMFDCAGCIGNNRVKDTTPGAEDDMTGTDVEADESGVETDESAFETPSNTTSSAEFAAQSLSFTTGTFFACMFAMTQ